MGLREMKKIENFVSFLSASVWLIRVNNNQLAVATPYRIYNL